VKTPRHRETAPSFNARHRPPCRTTVVATILAGAGGSPERFKAGLDDLVRLCDPLTGRGLPRRG